MNDFERRLSEQPFRRPPADLRSALFDAAEKVIAPPLSTWRDWFWPSPRAWVALAALWTLFAALAGDPPGVAPDPGRITVPTARGESPFFAFRHHSSFTDVLELSN